MTAAEPATNYLAGNRVRTTTTASSTLLDLLFDDGSVGRCLVAPDGTVLRVNGEWLRSTGSSAEDVVGADVIGLFPETRDVALAMHARARAGHHVRVPRHAERVAGREAWWEGSIDPVSMEGGTGLLITMRATGPATQDDTTARLATRDGTERRLEQALRDSEARYRMLFDSIDEGFCVVEVLFDPGGKPADYRFLEVNRAFEQQTGLVNATGRRMRELAPAHEAHWFEIYGRVASTGEPVRFENNAEALGRYYDVFAFRVGEPEQRMVAILFKDVSERHRAEEALLHANEVLREADRRKSEFLAILSHELRGPLAPIRNGIYLLERAEPGSEAAVRAKGIVHRQAEHLTRLVDDLLDMTRISRGKIALQRTRVDLRDVVRKTTDDLRSVFANAGVALRVDVRTVDPLWIDADATRMAQVLGNLLQNAVKFTPSGGSVVVSLERSAEHAELLVTDDGSGMESGTIERMFEPFAQADHSLARTRGGLGLGLALVKGLVEMHGGSVEARSEGPGRGSEFCVSLPLADA